MRFYRATTFLFPRHYEWRILLACFAAVLSPLLALATYQWATGAWQPSLLLGLFAASLVAAGLGMLAIRALLAPVARATATLGAIHRGEAVPPLPRGGDDLVGQLLRAVAVAANGSAIRNPTLSTDTDHDALTGLHSRPGFLDLSEKVLSGDSNSVIALIDIDHFQSINDRFGRAAGDALLRAVGHRLERGIRRSDLAARWSGEAFVVLLPDTQLDEARLVLERLRASVALDPLLGPESTGNAWPVTFSCGLAPVRAFSHLGDATHRAHAALNAAKNGGRNRVRIAGNG
ncbi:GGDEF domain-containing protein [Novosphingobium sp. BL-8A]|uniref:diguanylate cyclase domain-containing protein n=1 Tax=Novosphingobium sp. BL-8A TaxID=3127639 RepID=UPI0037581BF9